MKKLMTTLAIGLALTVGAAHAADEQKAPSAQQSKMTVCNKEAGARKGDERKKFMSSCLSGKPAEAAASDKKTAQQERMKQCNLDAKDKKGDERKKFMSECLKSK
ncbi:MAG: phosphate starvation-inducible protein PsiF [Curvibacter sp. GWA2_64_110]|nr:MAG: phosphate starvation-inducible protein PsiF [Curvibacter sp. GWA2_64_110]HCY15202.1 phosphate starvation-inducible protein PsiF [Curvibacter sp.]